MRKQDINILSGYTPIGGGLISWWYVVIPVMCMIVFFVCKMVLRL